MTRLTALIIVTLMFAYLWYWFSRGRFQAGVSSTARPPISRKRKRSKPAQVWVQVFETASREEAQHIQMRLEEENISVVVFEQAKKNIVGETPAGIGVVVTRDQSGYAQQLICRYLDRLDANGSAEPPKPLS